MSEEPHPAITELNKFKEATPANMISFDPEQTYYSTEKATYFVDIGNFYRSYSRKMPIKSGIKRYLEEKDTPSGKIAALMDYHLENIEIDRAVDWSGKLAGYLRGITSFAGRQFLITDGYNIPDSATGPCPLHLSIIRQAFPNEDALMAFCGWLQGGVKAIRAGIHQPAPMPVLAGEKGAGKSLIGYIVKQVFGGRSANPMTAWSGTLPWNDNLLGSELLLIDDSVASTDPRARKALGARFKEAIYSDNVEINTRNKTSISIRPVWRVMVCCNETPENLSVIPPLEEGIEDKIMLLKVSPVKTPMPAKEPEEKEAFRAALKAELPYFLNWLEKLQIPEHLSDSRSGITAWKDEELLQAVQEISPERRMEQLIALSIDKGYLLSELADSAWLSAAEVQEELQNRESPTTHQANNLLKYDTNAGRYLASLVKKGSPWVTDTKPVNGIAKYHIQKPPKVE